MLTFDTAPSASIRPEILQKRRLQARPCELTFSFTSLLHQGVSYYAKAQQRCCKQFKLAPRLTIWLDTSGRAHSGTLSISFAKTPEDGGQRCSYEEWRESWGEDINISLGVRVESNSGTKPVEECGIFINLRTSGRSHEACCLVSSLWLPCSICGATSLEPLPSPSKRRNLMVASSSPSPLHLLPGMQDRFKQANTSRNLVVSFSSSTHEGLAYSGGEQACCKQLKLAERLYIGLDTRGRVHSGILSVGFTTPSSSAAAADDLGPSLPSDGSSGSSSSGQSCSYEEWQRSWGPDVTIPQSVTISGNTGPQEIKECGLIITLRTSGRTHTATAWVQPAPSPLAALCRRCGTVPLAEAAAAEEVGGRWEATQQQQ